MPDTEWEARVKGLLKSELTRDTELLPKRFQHKTETALRFAA